MHKQAPKGGGTTEQDTIANLHCRNSPEMYTRYMRQRRALAINGDVFGTVVIDWLNGRYRVECM
jgi:hypothetical protein